LETWGSSADATLPIFAIGHRSEIIAFVSFLILICCFEISLQNIILQVLDICHWHFCVVTGVIYRARSFKREKAAVKVMSKQSIWGPLPSFSSRKISVCRSEVFPYFSGNEEIYVRRAKLGALHIMASLIASQELGSSTSAELLVLLLIHSWKGNKDFRQNVWGSYLWKLCS